MGTSGPRLPVDPRRPERNPFKNSFRNTHVEGILNRLGFHARDLADAQLGRRVHLDVRRAVVVAADGPAGEGRLDVHRVPRRVPAPPQEADDLRVREVRVEIAEERDVRVDLELVRLGRLRQRRAVRGAHGAARVALARHQRVRAARREALHDPRDARPARNPNRFKIPST